MKTISILTTSVVILTILFSTSALAKSYSYAGKFNTGVSTKSVKLKTGATSKYKKVNLAKKLKDANENIWKPSIKVELYRQDNVINESYLHHKGSFTTGKLSEYERTHIWHTSRVGNFQVDACDLEYNVDKLVVKASFRKEGNSCAETEEFNIMESSEGMPIAGLENDILVLTEETDRFCRYEKELTGEDLADAFEIMQHGNQFFAEMLFSVGDFGNPLAPRAQLKVQLENGFNPDRINNLDVIDLQRPYENAFEGTEVGDELLDEVIYNSPKCLSTEQS
jgi:hypothetical protein